MIAAILAQEVIESAGEKAKLVIKNLKEKKFPEVASRIEKDIEDTIRYLKGHCC